MKTDDKVIWEISIRRAAGKLDAPHDIDGVLDSLGFERLAMTCRHGERAGSLPPLHRDPFDRMLVAQAREERLILVSADAEVRSTTSRAWMRAPEGGSCP